MNTTNEDIQIYGKLVNVSTEGVVADASQIWSEKNKSSIEDVVKNIDNKIEDFKNHPEFDKAIFHGNTVFEGNTTVEGDQIIRGNHNVNGNQEVRGTLDVYDKLTAHGAPVSIQADNKITCNDLDVMGVFRALQLDCNTLTVHNLIKSEGNIEIDGDTIVNNITVNGRIEGLGTQSFLPDAREGNILVYTNGKWIAGNIDSIIRNDSNISNYINNLVSQSISQSFDASKYYTKEEIDRKLNDLKQNIGGDISQSCLWEVGSNGRLTPKGNKSVEADHFYKKD